MTSLDSTPDIPEGYSPNFDFDGRVLDHARTERIGDGIDVETVLPVEGEPHILCWLPSEPRLTPQQALALGRALQQAARQLMSGPSEARAVNVCPGPTSSAHEREAQGLGEAFAPSDEIGADQ